MANAGKDQASGASDDEGTKGAAQGAELVDEGALYTTRYEGKLKVKELDLSKVKLSVILK